MKITMVARAILMALILLTLTGCWDYKEYEDMALVFAIGFDSAPDQDSLTFTVEYLVSAGGGGQMSGKQATSTPQGVVYTVVSPTVETAIDKLQEGISRQLFFDYTRVIVIGEEAAREKMGTIIKFLDNTSRVHDYAYMFITPGEASDVLGTDSKYDLKSASQVIFDLTRQSTLNSFPVKLGAFKQPLFVDGIESTAPKLILEKLSTDDKADKASKSTETDSGLARIVEKQPGLITASGMAAFHGQKMVGWLDEQESRGWAWINNKGIKGYKYVYQVPGAPDEDKINFHLLSSKSKISTRIDNERIAVDLNIEATAAFEDSLPTNSEFVGPKEVAGIEEYLEQCIHADVAAALNKGQQDLQTDIFGFGFTFFRQHHKEWQNGIGEKWEQLFPELPIQIKVSAKIINTGIKIRF